MDHAIVLNRIQAVPGIMNTLFGFDVFCEVHIQPALSYESNDGEIICMYKAIKKTKDIRICMESLAFHAVSPTVHW